MISLPFINKNNTIKTIIAGEYYSSFSCDDIVIHTLISSCVAVCLYDTESKVYGMNHLMLGTATKEMSELELATRYGVHSMELLINDMLSKGAIKSNLQAKIFGGSSVLNTADNPNIGTLNSEFVKAFLDIEDIPLVASSLGGDSCRVIYMMPRTFTVHVRKVDGVGSSEFAKTAKSRWRKSIGTFDSVSNEQTELWLD
ncbi:MAG: chemotaxis protein CheD [Denitrovibrio sp.]|nr:MAG: chemotaxis protein CheD [Denitrovibrio sp.]